MSYNLVFWNQQPRMSRAPSEILEELNNGSPVEGLNELTVDEFLQRIIDTFPGAVREPNGLGEWIDWAATDEKSSFQVNWSPHHVDVTCRGLSGDQMNKFVDIGLVLDCPLYDPQTGERFASL